MAFAADPGLSSLDVQALVGAGEAAMPAWYPRVLCPGDLGSLVVLILLALPSARVWFRGQPAEGSRGSGRVLLDQRGRRSMR